MATTINATTTGLVETSDGTAVLDLQTGGTTALRVNATQAIGVGSTPSFGSAGQFLTSQGSAASPTWTTGGSGTVTSVSWTGGIVSIATATSTPAFTIAGTSGGIVYFNSASTWASSAALTQYGVVYGGGAGAAPVATAVGTTGQFLGANTGGAPTWQTPSGGGGGKVLQMVSSSPADATSTSQTLATFATLAITPTSATSRIIFTFSGFFGSNGARTLAGGAIALYNQTQSTTLVPPGTTDGAGYSQLYQLSGTWNTAGVAWPFSITGFDSPASTSAQTYQVQFAARAVSTPADLPLKLCRIVLWEIAP